MIKKSIMEIKFGFCLCEMCGDNFSIRKLEKHVKENHFWN
jgi:hypothetical protein